MRLALVVLVAGLSGACIDLFHRDWERVESPTHVDPHQAYRFEVPEGWALSGDALTRDGAALQNITIHDRALEADEKLLWDERTEGSVRALKILAPYPDLQVLDLVPATVLGRPGLRARWATENPVPWVVVSMFTARNPHHVREEGVTYGFISGDTLYELSYRAPALHYFARDLPAFERLVASFELLDPGESARGAGR